MPRWTFQLRLRACARSQRWATGCSFGSVSCSCDAAPRSVVRKQSLHVASSPLSEQRRTRLIFTRADRNLSSKSLARNAYLKLLDNRRKKTKNGSVDLRKVYTSASVDRSSISSASVAAGLFPNLSCLSLADDFLQRTLKKKSCFRIYFYLRHERVTKKDDKNSLQRFGVLHLLQREIVQRIRSWLTESQLRILIIISLWRRRNTPKRWRLFLSSFFVTRSCLK